MKIVCIGRNYSEHAKELGNAVPAEPVFFCKPDSAILAKGNPFFIPDWSSDVHYEAELVFRIHRLGKNIASEYAHRYYAEVGLGIDFTARDVQEELKKKGLPWEKAKGFDSSAVLPDEFIPLESLPDPAAIPFRLEKNGVVVQQATSAEMIFNIDQIIAYVSRFMTFKIGDLVYTGTPAGVGPVASGDLLEGFIGDKKVLKLKIR